MTTSPPPRRLPLAPAAPDGRRGGGPQRIAAIDIGSNSIRQIVADVSADGSIQVVDEMKAAPRLGTGLDETGALSEEAMARATSAISHMAALAEQLGARRIEAVATSAVRDAANGRVFLDRVRMATGLRVRLLDGEEEARLSYRSAVAHFDVGVGRTAVLDIGGGSLELALSADGIIEHLVSLPFGAVRMTERFLADGVTPKRMRRLRKHVRRELRDVVSARDWKGARVIGSGGTFTNLAGVVLARQGLMLARSPHGTPVSRAELEHVIDVLSGMSVEERREVPGVNEGRADIIVAGLAVAAEVMARIDARDLVVSRYGIREGILLEAARVVPVIADPGEARQRSVREFAERCRVEMSHAEQVQRLALRLFDTIGARLGCTPEERDTLADAALLHDSGYHISYDRHHKHSYHLIVHAELLGIDPTEQIVIANIARYHRGARPKKKHRNYGMLDRPLRDRIRRLSAILRVADGFDRGHVSAVEDLKVRWTDRALRITPTPSAPAHTLRLELWGAHRKSELLAQLAEVPVELVAPDRTVLSSAELDDGDPE